MDVPKTAAKLWITHTGNLDGEEWKRKTVEMIKHSTWITLFHTYEFIELVIAEKTGFSLVEGHNR